MSLIRVYSVIYSGQTQTKRRWAGERMIEGCLSHLEQKWWPNSYTNMILILYVEPIRYAHFLLKTNILCYIEHPTPLSHYWFYDPVEGDVKQAHVMHPSRVLWFCPTRTVTFWLSDNVVIHPFSVQKQTKYC